MLKTRITEMFGIPYPVMSAPMSLHSSGRLAAAVSQAGGLGLFGGTNPAGPDWLREQIQYIRSQTDAYKERIVESRGEDTIFTEVFDILDPAIFDIPAWPHGIAARALNNRFVQEWQGREEELRRNLDSVLPAYLGGCPRIMTADCDGLGQVDRFCSQSAIDCVEAARDRLSEGLDLSKTSSHPSHSPSLSA